MPRSLPLSSPPIGERQPAHVVCGQGGSEAVEQLSSSQRLRAQSLLLTQLPWERASSLAMETVRNLVLAPLIAHADALSREEQTEEWQEAAAVLLQVGSTQCVVTYSGAMAFSKSFPIDHPRSSVRAFRLTIQGEAVEAFRACHSVPRVVSSECINGIVCS